MQFASLHKNSTLKSSTPRHPNPCPPSFLVQILLARFLGQNIKCRLRAKPTRHLRAHSLIRKRSLLVANLDGVASPSAGRRIRHQLRVAALFQAQEPEDGGLDGLTDGEEAVVLEQGGFAGAEGGGDVVAFSFGKDDAIEGGVEGVIL